MASDKSSDRTNPVKRTSAESKAEITKRISQEIQETEDAIRNAKTERLKAARLAMLEKQSNPEPGKKRVRKPKAQEKSEA